MADVGSQTQLYEFPPVGSRLIETRPDGTEITHRVTWVGKKKARLHADLGYAWQTATVWMERVMDSPDWRIAE